MDRCKQDNLIDGIYYRYLLDIKFCITFPSSYGTLEGFHETDKNFPGRTIRMILNPAEVVVRKIVSRVTDYVEDITSFMYAAVEIYYTIMRKNLHVHS